ncbi:bifunctional copper resistance protein CopD/cytochrome c oxidase assembly protein [Nocardioides sp. HDW12B]|uniref:cytochrome c oxidase assembly protein n=1 Tax=Nocardioides sp. HDW12B TaxID=2714939 RepID=UPI0014075A2F|nr:cytochrome c oxidase assembly protein [Nocardioides sp. HDW12B]QIK68002.1 bifunctional copper resistance protein CopD/cytochrome c oxidase assembly protein [Nocardioides sp. HDW12B]
MTPPTTTEPAANTRDTPARGLTGSRLALLVLLPALVAGGVLLALAGGVPAAAPVGLPDPGRVTTLGLPLAGLLDQLLAVLVVGSLLVPLLTMRRPDEEVRGRAFKALWTVRRLALAWVVVTAAVIVLTVSDQFAVPVWQLTPDLVGQVIGQSDLGLALFVQLLLVTTVAVASRWALKAREVGAVLGLALAAVVPAVLTGHAASSGSHDTAVVSMLVHVWGVVIWMGGVVALAWHLGSDDERRALAARRFSPLAAWCFALVGLSGALNAAVRLGSWSALVTTGYGAGVVAKVLVLVAVGLVAARLRSGVRASSEATGRGVLARLLALEVAVLSAAIGLGVALSRTPTPVGEPYTSAAESLLGGPLPPAPTLGRLLWSFTPSGVGLVVVGLGAALYLRGLLRLRQRGDRWPVGRTVAWFAGLATVGYVTIGGLGVYSHVAFSAHMTAHMALSMLAPILLVVGAPVTLALRALPGPDVPGGVGPRQMLAALLRSRFVAFWAHPLVASLLFVVSLYGVYFSGLFGALMMNHLGHALMEVHFLLTGYLFFEVLIGDAPIPRRLPHLARLGLLIVVMPFHAFFSIAMMNTEPPVGGEFYALLDRPWASDLSADQYLGGSIAWGLGEVPIVMVVIVVLFQWFRQDRTRAARADARADRDDDAELRAYNERLAAIAGRDAGDAGPRGQRAEPAERPD